MSNTLEQAVSAIKAGDKDTGQRLLNQVLQTNPRSETAWLWMTAVVDSDEQKRKCLEQVLSINPNNEIAQRGLAKLGPSASLATDVQIAARLESPQQSEIPLQQAHEANESEAVKKCPYCAETIKAEAIVCRFCGRDLGTGQALSTAIPSNQSAESQSPLLDRKVEELTILGWQVINRTPKTAQLRKPKQWSSGCLVLFVLLPLLGGLLFPALFGVAVVGLILAVLDYLIKKDETVYYTEEQLEQAEQYKQQQQREREEERKPEKDRQHARGLIIAGIIIVGLVLVFIFVTYTYPLVH